MNRRVSLVFTDALMLLVLLLILLPHNPVDSKPRVEMYSNLVVAARWPDNTSADVDLWVRSPGDIPVGYSRLRGNSISLLRDDVADIKDPTWRYELAASRNTPDGEYVVNLHLYADRAKEVPIPVEIEIFRRTESGVEKIWSGDRTLSEVGEEITVVRFKMKRNRPIQGTFHSDAVKLR